MKRLLYRPLFLFLLFILFFLILNIFVLPLLDNISVVGSFFTMYSFWFIMIVFLYLISRTLLDNESPRDEDV